MFQAVPVSIIRSSSLYTQQYIQVCIQLASRIRMERPEPARKLYNIYRCYAYGEKLLMMDGGTVRNTKSFIPNIN